MQQPAPYGARLAVGLLFGEAATMATRSAARPVTLAPRLSLLGVRAKLARNRYRALQAGDAVMDILSQSGVLPEHAMCGAEQFSSFHGEHGSASVG
jgi:hypothetical protein